MDRRERLRNCIIQYYIDNGREPTFFTRLREEEKKEEEAEVEEKFYTEGPEELKAARLEFAKYSIPRSNARIKVEKLKRKESNRLEAEEEVDRFIEGIGQYRISRV